MNTPITKRQARELLRVDSDAEMARVFNVTRSAVAQWPLDEPLPDKRQLQLAARVVRPLRRRSH